MPSASRSTHTSRHQSEDMQTSSYTGCWQRHWVCVHCLSLCNLTAVIPHAGIDDNGVKMDEEEVKHIADNCNTKKLNSKRVEVSRCRGYCM